MSKLIDNYKAALIKHLDECDERIERWINNEGYNEISSKIDELTDVSNPTSAKSLNTRIKRIRKECISGPDTLYITNNPHLNIMLGDENGRESIENYSSSEQLSNFGKYIIGCDYYYKNLKGYMRLHNLNKVLQMFLREKINGLNRVILDNYTNETSLEDDMYEIISIISIHSSYVEYIFNISNISRNFMDLIYSARGHLHKHIQRDPIKHALEDAVNKAIELWDEYDKTTLHTDMVNDLYPIIIKDHNLMEEYNVNINDEKAKMAFINSFKTSLRKALAPHAKKRGLRKGDKGVKKIEKD